MDKELYFGVDVSKKTPYGLGATPVRPGYPEKFAKQLVKQSGDKFLVPEEKK